MRGFEEITATQNWLAQLGEVFTGQSGVNIYRQMQGAVQGATSLTKEQDVIMFRAAREAMMQKGEWSGRKDWIGTMMYMEQALTPAMFTAVRNQIRGMAGSEEQEIAMMAKQFNVTYTIASQIRDLEAKEAVSRIEKFAETRDTPEMRVLSVQLAVQREIREFGGTLVGYTGRILEIFENLFGVGPDREPVSAIGGDDPAFQRMQAEAEKEQKTRQSAAEAASAARVEASREARGLTIGETPTFEQHLDRGNRILEEIRDDGRDEKTIVIEELTTPEDAAARIRERIGY